ncbi:ATP-binding protein [Paraburkholderia unamae]|uniref:ATP-binding protein n=1 Tax=Paraburkholderia unamae TaxID=219649 RepID=UPI003CCC5122
MNVVFVGGVHGVGKSTTCECVASTYGYAHVSASDLIRRERADAVAANGKLVNDVEGNQYLLIRGFRRFRDLGNTRCILLDGHFVLRDSDGDIQRLPLSVFRALAPSRIVCFEDDPVAIASRLQQRDLNQVEVNQVSSLQDQELSHASDVASDLRVPLTALRAFDRVGLQRLLSMP